MSDANVSATIRAVRSDDLPMMAKFIEPFVATGKLLPRTTQELEDLLPHGFIAESDGRIVGFAALEIYSPKMSEIRSLAVAPEFRGSGIGKRLVQHCVERPTDPDVLGDIVVVKVKVLAAHQVFDVAQVTRQQVVHANHFVAFGQEAFAKMAAEKSGATGDQHAA